MKRVLYSTAVLAVAFAGVAQAQTAFRFDPSGDEISVDRESHWRNWVYQNNLVREVSSPMDSTGLFDFSSPAREMLRSLAPTHALAVPWLGFTMPSALITFNTRPGTI